MSNIGSVTVGSQAASAPIATNGVVFSNQPLTTPFLIGLCCAISAGASLTYSIQVTCDPYPLTANSNWVNHDVITGKTASAYGNVAYPVTGVRLNVTTYSSGTVNMGVAQWP